jgi:hypothetical protein
MTRHDTLQCVHEPFGDAYYFGPERLAERYESDPQARKESGYEDSTYRTIFDRIARENSEVRLLVFFSLVPISTFNPTSIIAFWSLSSSFVSRPSARQSHSISLHPPAQTFICGYIAQDIDPSIC